MAETSPNQGLFEKYMTKSDSPEPNFDRYSLSPTGFTKHRDKPFCTESNLDQCVAYLNQELGVLGFPSLYDKSGTTQAFSVVRLVNNFYEILQLQVKSNQVKDELEARQQRSDCDNEFLSQCQTRLKGELDLSHREVAQLKVTKTELVKIKKTLENTVKCQKEDIKKIKSNVQHLRKQFEHETRKKETELTKMKEKIVQLLNDKTKEKCLGMEILNSIQRVDGKRGTWSKGKKHEEEMYRLLINNYEERQKELMEENNDLRELLKHTEDQLVNLLNKENQDIETDSRDEGCSDDDCVSVSSLTGGHYQMPLELVREGIERSIREKWTLLKEKMDNSKKDETKETTKEDHVYHDKIIKLTSELDKYKHIVMQQEEHLQELQDSRSHSEKVGFLDDSLIAEEKEKIEKEKRLFKNEKRTFDEERKRFTEAAIKLGHERERFDEERALFLKQQLLNSSPSPKSMSRGKVKNDEDEHRGRKLHIQTPVFLAAPSKAGGPISTPSTEDLYSALTLKTNREHVADETPRRRYDHEGSGSRKTSSQSSGDDLIDVMNGNQFSARKSKRIDQHAHNIRKALLKQHNSFDNSAHSTKVP